MVILFLSTTSFADGLDTLSLTSMTNWNNTVYEDTASMGVAYDKVIRQLGAGISNRAVAPVRSLGIHGGEVSLRNSITFLDAQIRLDGSPSPWALMTPDEAPMGSLWIPEVAIRKGLPLSTEFGLKMGYIGNSRQGSFGGWGRASILEGYQKTPDLAIQVGYSGYTGNNELALGVMDISLSMGKSFGIGPFANMSSSHITPYSAVGLLSYRAMPRVDEALSSKLGIERISAFSSSTDFTEGYRALTVDAGLHIQSNDFFIHMGSHYTGQASFGMSGQIGLTY
jgi:hypothetical protein